MQINENNVRHERIFVTAAVWPLLQAVPRRQYQVIAPTKQVFEWGCRRLSVRAHVSPCLGAFKLIPP